VKQRQLSMGIGTRAASRANIAALVIVRRADDQCRDSACFNHMRDDTDGLVAERSVGNQQGEIDFSSLQFSDKGGRQFVFNFSMFAQAAHERKVKRRERADSFFLSQ